MRAAATGCYAESSHAGLAGAGVVAQIAVGDLVRAALALSVGRLHEVAGVAAVAGSQAVAASAVRRAVHAGTGGVGK